MWVALAAGLVIGLVLGLLGGGGSILAVPVLVYLFDEGAQEAMVGALIVVTVSSISAVLTHARTGDVRWRDGLVFGALGTLGAWAGSHLSGLVDPTALLVAFGLLLLMVAALMIRRTLRGGDDGAGGGENGVTDGRPVTFAGEPGTTAGQSDPPSEPARRWDGAHLVRLVLAASALGLLTGFFGVGGGFAVVPALLLALNLPMTAAVGTSLIVITINSLTALASRLGAGVTPDWSVVVPFALAAAVAGVVGGHLAPRLPAKVISRAFAGLLVAVGVWMVVSSATS